MHFQPTWKSQMPPSMPPNTPLETIWSRSCLRPSHVCYLVLGRSRISDFSLEADVNDAKKKTVLVDFNIEYFARCEFCIIVWVLNLIDSCFQFSIRLCLNFPADVSDICTWNTYTYISSANDCANYPQGKQQLDFNRKNKGFVKYEKHITMSESQSMSRAFAG